MPTASRPPIVQVPDELLVVLGSPKTISAQTLKEAGEATGRHVLLSQESLLRLLGGLQFEIQFRVPTQRSLFKASAILTGYNDGSQHATPVGASFKLLDVVRIESAEPDLVEKTLASASAALKPAASASQALKSAIAGTAAAAPAPAAPPSAIKGSPAPVQAAPPSAGFSPAPAAAAPAAAPSGEPAAPVESAPAEPPGGISLAAISELMQGLVGRDVVARMDAAATEAKLAPAYTGVYVDDAGAPKAFWVCDEDVCYFSGGALSMIPLEFLQETRQKGEKSQEVIDNFKEILNVGASTIQTAVGAHLRLQTMVLVKDGYTDEIKEAMSKCKTRTDFKIDVADYGAGSAAILF
jgi:hypothetical protein